MTELNGNEIYENDIEFYINAFCEENGIDDLRKESQSVWNGCLRYINKKLFADKNKLKQHDNINYKNGIMSSNCNMYNYDLLNYICDIYIDYCFLYDKEISQLGYCNLTGLNNDTLWDWSKDNNKFSNKGCEIYKKLITFREESLSNKLVTGNKNPVGVIACLNRHYGWASPYTADSNRQKQTLADAELPTLTENNNSFVQIAERKKIDKTGECL